MISITLHYLFSCWKRLLLLSIICSVIPMIMIKDNYPISINFNTFMSIWICSIPWILWVQQIYFSGLGFNRKRNRHLKGIFISSFLASLTVIMILPSTNHQKILLDTMLPYLTAPKNNVVTSSKGTLVQNLSQLEGQARLFAMPSSSGIWIDSNNIVFNKIRTNGTVLTLSEGYLFNENGYQPVSGKSSIPFTEIRYLFPDIPLGKAIVQKWLDSVYEFNDSIKKNYHISQTLPKKNKPSKQNIIYRKPEIDKKPNSGKPSKDKAAPKPKLSNTEKSNIITQYVDSIKPTEKTIHLYDRFNAFLSIWCIFLTGSLLGILISIHQNIIGSFALIILLAIYAAPYSTMILSSTVFIHKLIPNIPAFALNSVLQIILSFFCIILSALKFSVKKGGRS